MFGLFRNTFDYHRFVELIAVSKSRENLEAHYDEMPNDTNSGTKWPMFTEEKSDDDKTRLNEWLHYVIKEVKEV